MKKTCIILLILCAAILLAPGCKEKKDVCEGYSPWPSAEAMAAWKEYTSEHRDSMDGYNSVSALLNYFGRNPSFCHDSVVANHDEDSVLVCGYLNLWKSYGTLGVYMLTDEYHSEPIDTEKDAYATVYIDNHESVDTLRKAYIAAVFYSTQIPDDYPWDYCCGYNYKMYTYDSQISYKE